jgi:zinc protease
MLLLKRCLVAIAVALAMPSLASAKEIRLLDRVFFVKDVPGSPVNFHMIVNAGCLDEADGQCRGLAHYLEHLVLVGRNPQHRDMAVRMFAGATANGWTNDRATVYLHKLQPREGVAPLEELEKLFQFYSARLKDFHIAPEEADRERNVVMQEHDWRVQSNPYRLADREMWGRLIPDHPSGQWVIGTRDDIRAFTVEASRAYHRSWYHLNNAWFVVSGDLETEAVKAIAARALEDLKPQQLPPRNFRRSIDVKPETIELETKAEGIKESRVTVTRMIRMFEQNLLRNRAQRRVFMTFMNSQLPGSPYDQLIEQGKLASNRVFVYLARVAPETFVLSLAATAAPGVEPAHLRAEMLKVMNSVGDETAMSDEVIQRLKERIARTEDRIENQPSRTHARLINWLANRNDYADLAGWAGVTAGVTGAEVRAFGKAFAAGTRTAIGVQMPQEQPK